jgi:hypothetical protein
VQNARSKFSSLVTRHSSLRFHAGRGFGGAAVSGHRHSDGVQSGTVTEGILDFRWKLTSQSWPGDPVLGAQSLQLLTAEVTYSAQGKDYSVQLSTLATSPAQQTSTTTSQF